MQRDALVDKRSGIFGVVAMTLTLLLVCGSLSVAAGQDQLGAAPPPPAEQADTGAEPAEPVVGDDPIPTKNLLAALRDGGPMLFPLAFCSFLLFVFVFERAISLRRGRVIPRPFVKRFLHQLQDGQLERKEALARCQENRSPVAEVFAAGVMKWHRPAVEVEQAMIDGGERVSNGLRRYLRLFNGISTISPLLGLLGTVIGMIRAFNAIATADAMGRPELLAAGISQALLTTAAGLTVAIPAIIAYLFFSSRVDRLIIDIDALSQQVVQAIASDTWKETSNRRTPSKGQPGKAA
jgi:biopolymer transport protein ExbB